MALAQNTDILDQLREGIATLTTSEQWVRSLDVQRRFHTYSWGNCLLIAMQRPDASHVAGYRKWQQLGRQVRKGEKGIAIIAPCAHKFRKTVGDGDRQEEVDVRVITAFRATHVFDISQTDGEPLPEIAERLLGDDPADAFFKLQAVTGALDFTVEVVPLGDSLNGDCNHASRRIRVNADVSPMQGVKTLSHEIAHALLHGPDRVPADMSRGVKELEAESVAYVVCQELGIDSSQYTFGYVAGWAGGGRRCFQADLRVRTADQRCSPGNPGCTGAHGRVADGGGGLMAASLLCTSMCDYIEIVADVVRDTDEPSTTRTAAAVVAMDSTT